jgi:hypothetical protein
VYTNIEKASIAVTERMVSQTQRFPFSAGETGGVAGAYKTGKAVPAEGVTEDCAEEGTTETQAGGRGKASHTH